MVYSIPDWHVSYAAAGYGISSLERHITLDRSMYGSNQAASLEPRGDIISFVIKNNFAKGKNMYGNITKEEQKISKN